MLLIVGVINDFFYRVDFSKLAKIAGSARKKVLLGKNYEGSNGKKRKSN